jgi:transposase
MWTTNNRARYDRSFLRYPSDLTDDEWALVEPLIPPAKRGGDKRTVIMREVVNGLMYILSTGCQWRAIPKDLPPRSTIHGYFDLWSWDGTLDRIHHMLYVKCREALGREASPTAAVIDSQSVKSAEKGGLRSIRRVTMREKRYSRRYARPADPRPRARRRHSGSRWRRTRHGDAIRSLSIPAEALRRWWLSRPLVSPRYGKNNGASKCRNRQAIRSREGLHRLAQAMGRRAHVRVAWTMQAPGQGLGKSQPPRPRIPTSRVDQAHAEKAMQSNMIFPDRLLVLLSQKSV